MRVIILLLWAFPGAAQTVEGFVLNASNHRGVPDSTVELIQDNQAIYTATTDAQGNFRFENVNDGTYSIRFHAAGFNFGQSQTAGHPIRVHSGSGAEKIGLTLTAQGKISGRVLDGRGDPVPHAYYCVQSADMMTSQTADAHGNFELKLPASAFTLWAAPPGDWKPPDPEPDTNRRLAWTRTWYPGVADSKAASRIVIRPNAEVSGIVIKLLAVPTHAIEGVVLDPYGAPAPDVQLLLRRDNIPFIERTKSRAGGSFEFPEAVDGDWRITGEVESGGVKWKVDQWIEIAGRPLENVKLRLNAPFTVRGKVIFDVPEGWATPKPSGVFLFPVRDHHVFDDNLRSERVQSDGTFTVDQAYPGAYSIQPASLVPGYYMDAIRFGAVPLITPEVELSAGSPPITVIYKTHGGSLRGTVEQCASGGVALVPQDPAMRYPGFTYGARCDARDRYDITGIRPGDYYALASFSPGDTPPFWTPRFDDRYVTQADRVTIRPGESTTADLKILVQPEQ